MRILLTEDDEAVRAFVARALELDGHNVDTACDGVEALETLVLNDGDYDLLVSDVKMPMMDGIALAHNAADRWPGMRILLMTGFADQRERARSSTFRPGLRRAVRVRPGTRGLPSRPPQRNCRAVWAGVTGQDSVPGSSPLHSMVFSPSIPGRDPMMPDDESCPTVRNSVIDRDAER